jgi:two-component system response regulator HydG
MAIAVFAQDHFPLDEVTVALRRDGVDASSVKLDLKAAAPTALAGIEKCALIIPEQGVVDIGEQTTFLREAIGAEIPLILCSPVMMASDRRILHECGASEIITPRSWSARHVAERLLAELILQGNVHPSSCGALRGATLNIREMYEHIKKLAPLSEPILILGETGTGKELVAREIHDRSGRPEPFLAINCAELSPELLGSELFGHERGAFTGAAQSRKGLLAAAGNGTVFLDEIGDLDLGAQAKLLRVIQDKQVRPVGSNIWLKFQARVVLATNRNLEQDAGEGKFRNDLFERIRGFSLEMPPLRERRADIPLLVHHFVKEYDHEYPGNLVVPSGSLDCLFRYHWPGNVRELRAVIRRAAAYADDMGRINAVLLQETVRSRDSIRPSHQVTFDPTTDNWRELLKRVQANYFRAVLRETKGNKEAAAKLAGLSRSQFYEKLKELESEE